MTDTGGPNRIFTDNGDDVIDGRNGRDLLCGNGGRDTLEIDGGQNRASGGGGADTFVISRQLERTVIEGTPEHRLGFAELAVVRCDEDHLVEIHEDVPSLERSSPPQILKAPIF